MTLDETAQLLAAVAMAYPGRVTPEAEAVPLWHSFLADVSAPEARAAFNAHVATSVHPPCVADIRNAVASKRAPSVDVDTAWDEIRRAIGRCGRDREPQWSSPAMAAAVRAIGWREICNTLDDDLPALRAHLRLALESANARAHREANVLALEGSKSRGAVSAGEAVKNLLAGTPVASGAKGAG